MIWRGFVGSSLVLVGGLLTATLPPSTPVLRVELLGQLRGLEAGRMAGLVLVLAGLGLLAGTWLRLCRAVTVAEGTSVAERVARVRLTAVAWCLPLLLAPPLFSRDGWSYAAQGMLAEVGLSPYENGPGALVGVRDGFLPLPGWLTGPPVVQAVDPMWWDTVTPYGPVPLVFGEAGAALTGNPWVLVVGHRLVAMLGWLLLVWAVPRMAAWSGADPALASALVLASPLMLANGVAGLHNDLLMVGLMAAALVVTVERGWVWGAVLAGTAAAVKVPGGLVCVGIVLVSLPVAATLGDRLRRLSAAGLVSVGTLLGLGVVSGLGNGWITALTVPGEVATPLSATTLVGGFLDQGAALVGLDTGATAFRDLLRLIGLAAAAVIGARVVLRRPTGDRPAAVAAVATTAAAFVLLAPVVHLWYLLMLPPFLATLRLRRHGTGALVAVFLIAGIVAPLDSSLHGAYLAIVLGCMTVALLLPLLLLTPAARERVERIAASLAPDPPVPPVPPVPAAGVRPSAPGRRPSRAPRASARPSGPN